MKFFPKYILACLTILSLSCKTLVPDANSKFERGYYIQYTKLNFNIIATSQDTSWHKQIQPLSELLIQHPNWTVKLKTFLADSSSAKDIERLDMIVVSKISQYLVSKGISSLKLIAMGFNNTDDKSRLKDQKFMKDSQKHKKFRKNTFEWEIIATK